MNRDARDKPAHDGAGGQQFDPAENTLDSSSPDNNRTHQDEDEALLARCWRPLAERGPIGSGWNGPSRISR